jgi:hypothetical protein
MPITGIHRKGAERRSVASRLAAGSVCAFCGAPLWMATSASVSLMRSLLIEPQSLIVENNQRNSALDCGKRTGERANARYAAFSALMLSGASILATTRSPKINMIVCAAAASPLAAASAQRASAAISASEGV